MQTLTKIKVENFFISFSLCFLYLCLRTETMNYCQILNDIHGSFLNSFLFSSMKLKIINMYARMCVTKSDKSICLCILSLNNFQMPGQKANPISFKDSAKMLWIASAMKKQIDAKYLFTQLICWKQLWKKIIMTDVSIKIWLNNQSMYLFFLPISG